MVNFMKSFEQGITRAEKVRVEKKEIGDIFKDLKTQVLDGTEGKIKIEIGTALRKKEKTRSKSNTALSQSSILGSAMLTTSPLYFGRNIFESFYDEETEKYTAIIAYCMIDGKEVANRVLAEWSASEDGGFPCRVEYQDVSRTAYDKESLVGLLEGLIESAHSGMIFEELLSL